MTAETRVACPSCPDGYVWTPIGPTNRPCPTCMGLAFIEPAIAVDPETGVSVEDRTNAYGGGEVTIAGRNREAVEAKAERIRASIDYMRSPTYTIGRSLDGRFVARLTYWGLD